MADKAREASFTRLDQAQVSPYHVTLGMFLGELDSPNTRASGDIKHILGREGPIQSKFEDLVLQVQSILLCLEDFARR